MDEELVAEEEDKNWKGICIAVLVISSIISCIAVAIFILTPKDLGPRVNHPRLSLEDIIGDHFQPEDFEGSWVSDSEVVLKNSDGSLIIFDAIDNTSHVIVPNTTLRQFNVQKYSVSSDKKFVLLIHDLKKVFDKSYVGKYKIFNVSNEHVFPLEAPKVSTPSVSSSDGSASSSAALMQQFSSNDIQYASWGPRGNQIVFVHQNNIYYYNSIQEVPSPAKQLTTSGQINLIYNGVPDWLYAEKIIKRDNAIWFSPDGSRISYATFDDSKVAPMSYPKYGSYDDPNNVYPRMVQIRYPLAGRENPEVTLWVTDLRSGGSSVSDSKRLLPPQEILGRDHYFTSFSWIDDEKCAVIWMKREQNYSVVSLCSEEKNWICERHLQEKLEASESVGWVEMFDAPLITSDKRHYLLRLPMNDADAGSFRQIAMITINGRVKNWLTQGQHDVTQILGARSDIRTVFYVGTLDEKPGERHIFSIPDIHSSLPRNPSCLTCNQTERNCSYHEAIFSPKSTFFILRCLGPGIPWTEIRTVDENEIIMKTDLDRNIVDLVSSRSFPQFRSFRVPLNNKFYAEVQLIFPPSLREYEYIRFPLVVEILPEPGGQGVSSQLSVDWGMYLASKRDFIYARIDVRGSRFQGDKNLHETWRRLGSVEVDDYLQVVSYLKQDLHYVDPGRTAVWGWSYGGFVASSLISHEKSAFNCAIAVAPVTNWLFADSFTAERYFGHPWASGNFMRYEKSDLIHKAISFRDKNLFIIHGTADDSVHLQNSFAFMKALNDAGVIYKSQLYPDSNHNLDDVKYHFYRSMESYLMDCFKIKDGDDLIEMQKNPGKSAR